jgi:hypothetical protein
MRVRLNGTTGPDLRAWTGLTGPQLHSLIERL